MSQHLPPAPRARHGSGFENAAPAGDSKLAGVEVEVEARASRGVGMMAPVRAVLMIAVTLAVLGGSWSWGAPLSLWELWSVDEARAEVARRIFLELRPARLVAGLLIGASLSIAGAGLQGLFRNPLAEPYLLGISAGGALGAALALSIGAPGDGVPLVGWGTLLAFVGALGSAVAVYALGRSSASPGWGEGITSDRARLLLVGVALSAFLSALMSLVIALSGRPELAQRLTFWLLGGLNRSGWSENMVLALGLGIGGALMWSCARDLNALRGGDEVASSLGVEARVLRRRVLLAASLLSASCVAVAGLIGFIGLLGPHLIRLAGVRDVRLLLPGAAWSGGLLLCGSDALARSLFAPIEVPVGIVTALLGVPLFLVLARRL